MDLNILNNRKSHHQKSLKVTTILFIFIFLFFPGIVKTDQTQQLNLRFSVQDSHLNSYIKDAMLKSPELRSAFLKWKAAVEKSSVVSSLPDPNFTFAWFIEQVETRVGPQQGKIGLMQKFPWFGKLKLKGKNAAQIADSFYNNYERIRLDILYRVKSAYYDLYFTDSSIRILGDNILLLKTANDQLYARYKTGIATYSNLIRIQVEVDKLNDQLATLRDKRPAIVAELNSILNRPLNSNINVTDKINGLNLNLSKKVLMEELLKFNPALKTIRDLENAGRTGVKLAKKEYFPDIAIGADYIFTGRAVSMAPPDSGKDPFLIKMSVNLPVRFKRIASSLKEAKLKLESVHQALINKKNMLKYSLEKSWFKFRDSLRKVKLYRDSLIPKARQAFEVTKTAFSTGKAGFADFIDTQRMLLRFELMLEKSRTSYHKNLAHIEKITGLPFSHTGKKTIKIGDKNE